MFDTTVARFRASSRNSDSVRAPATGSDAMESSVKRIAIYAAIGGLVLAFIAVLALAIIRELPESNSYALLAQGWLEGRFDTPICWDGDCASIDGKAYIIFPPFPGIVALPFVAIFGTGFKYFMLISAAAFALSGWLWWQMFRQESETRDQALLLVAGVLFATPLIFVTLRGDHVWFFAQSIGFLLSTAALYSALVRRDVLLTGFFIALAFLSRQMTILYLPFLYVLLLDPGQSWWKINGAAIRRGLTLAAFPLLALAVYCAYNYARFGSPLETGYSFIFPASQDVSDNPAQFLRLRVRELGIFSPEYLSFNFLYMFINGPHVEFAGRYMTDLTGFDTNGASLFLVTPALFFAFMARWDRTFWFGLLTCGLILGLTLLYHSNGYSQYSAQRYALDWLPILMIFLARGVKPAHIGPFAILTTYSMFVTLGMIVIGGLVAS
jgi:hypothetical protein